MIVRDSARTLPPCLASISPWVDEMIVVDTGSKDDTRAIARHHGATIFEFPWCDDFAAARNESLRHARGDWDSPFLKAAWNSPFGEASSCNMNGTAQRLCAPIGARSRIARHAIFPVAMRC